MADKYSMVLLTGPPGVGKTTLIRNICQDLIENHKIYCKGFYTDEVRSPSTRERIGFDVVTLEGKHAALARSGVNIKGPYVGKYGVFIKDFENLVLPLLKPFAQSQHLLVIDEIGKMELKSKQFETAVCNCLDKTPILATVPYEMRQPLPLVGKLKSHPKASVIIVTKENRNRIQSEIVCNILKIVGQKK